MINTIDLENKTDEEIVALVLENQNNFEYLVRRYQSKLGRYIRRLSNVGEEEIEDLLQNIFIKAYLNINDFDNSLKFSSWIYRIAHNEVIDNHRRLKARPQLIDADILDSNIKELVAETNLLEHVAASEFKESISKAIKKLSLKYQEVIVLKFIEEKDYQEISDIIKKPLGTVASRMNKAKAELRQIISQKKII